MEALLNKRKIWYRHNQETTSQKWSCAPAFGLVPILTEFVS